MMKSMTAFARLERKTDQGILTWEVRSVNHRYLERNIYLPKELQELEMQVYDKLGKQIKRGKIDAKLNLTIYKTKLETITINSSVTKNLNEALRKIMVHLPNIKPPTATDILRWPGIIHYEQVFNFSLLHKIAIELLQDTISRLIIVRCCEGKKLASILSEKVYGCSKQIKKAKLHIPFILENFKQRLKKKLAKIIEQLDPIRIEQEVIIAAQKLDIDEELERLTAHLAEVKQILNYNEPIGRRLDFLMQELNRETNTIASKSGDKEMTTIAIELKILIEQIREQAQNIE